MPNSETKKKNPYVEPKYCLDILYAYFFLAKRSLNNKAESILRRFQFLHEISTKEAMLLAYMSHHDVSPWHSNDGCTHALHISIHQLFTLIYQLNKKNVLDSYLDSCGHLSYRVHPDFLKELEREDKMSGATEGQLHGYIHTYATDLLYANCLPLSPIDYLETILGVNDLLIFSKGYREIGVKDFSLAEKCFFFILADSFIRNGIAPIQPRDLNIVTDIRKGKTSEENGLNAGDSRFRLFSEGMRGLIQRGIAVLVPCESDVVHRSDHDRDLCMLSPSACGKLFKGQDQLIEYRQLSHLATLFAGTSIKQKELFFDDDFKAEVEEIRALFIPAKYDQFIHRLEEKRLNKSINILFHGEPGTGKTELAMQLARESGRDIFIADLARLEDAYVGESEKNYRQLFRTFSYIAAISSNPPILLLNEADGMLGKRVQVERGFDKYANGIQNILLEEMERFEGVLIATTNLTVNMDKAFERRFPFKLRFRRPSPETSCRIWKLRLPYLSDDLALQLASDFMFSGGQIDNIAKRSDLFEVVHDTTPTVEQIAEYCRAETAEARKEADGRTTIEGFLPPLDKKSS